MNKLNYIECDSDNAVWMNQNLFRLVPLLIARDVTPCMIKSLENEGLYEVI
jgi:hypothetical protein